jgi:hypothetical protein
MGVRKSHGPSYPLELFARAFSHPYAVIRAFGSTVQNTVFVRISVSASGNLAPNDFPWQSFAER